MSYGWIFFWFCIFWPIGVLLLIAGANKKNNKDDE